MLQFIVLGQIPGTNIQLSFSWIFIILFLIALVSAYLFNPTFFHRSLHIKPQKTHTKKHTKRQTV